MCSVDGCQRASKTHGKPNLCNSHYEKRRKARNAERAARGIGKLCSVADCGGAHHSGGLCSLHARRMLRTGTTDPSATTIARETHQGKPCTVDGCDRPNLSYGLCGLHDGRKRATGSTDKPNRPKGRTPRDPLARLADKLTADWSTGCWLWTGYLNKDGYGTWIPDTHTGQSVRVHRWLFQELTGVKLAAHVQLDHSCKGGTRQCAKPGHLYAVTQAEHNVNTKARTRASADGMEYPVRRQHQSVDELQFGIKHGLPTALHDALGLGDDAEFTAFSFSA